VAKTNQKSLQKWQKRIKNHCISGRKSYNLCTKEACLLIECTRQNLAYMIKTDVLHPIKTGGNENLFLKGDVDRKRME